MVVARVDSVIWPAKGLLERPTGFAGLPGGISEPGPVRPLLLAIAAGAVLVLGGAAYGPVADFFTKRRTAQAGTAGPKSEKVGT